MLAAEEILGIAGVERKGLESHERAEARRRPFPTVPDQLRYPERAVACGCGVDVDRVPVIEVEIAAALVRRVVVPWTRVWRVVAPRKGAFFAGLRSISSTVELSFRG